MKKQNRKLGLNRETVRSLPAQDLVRAGGAGTIFTNCQGGCGSIGSFTCTIFCHE